MNKEDQHGTEDADNKVWLYLLAGYVIGFVAARMLAQHGAVGRRAGALIGGLGVALSGRSLGNPWRT